MTLNISEGDQKPWFLKPSIHICHMFIRYNNPKLKPLHITKWNYSKNLNIPKSFLEQLHVFKRFVTSSLLQQSASTPCYLYQQICNQNYYCLALVTTNIRINSLYKNIRSWTYLLLNQNDRNNVDKLINHACMLSYFSIYTKFILGFTIVNYNSFWNRTLAFWYI
jgi:hypothetical protein